MHNASSTTKRTVLRPFDRRGTACCLVLAASLVGAPAAVADTLADTIVIDGRIDVAAPDLLSLARQQADLALRQTPSQRAIGAASQQQTEPTEESLRKRGLIVGLVGAGTAVAGIFVWRGDSGPNLPGITSGRKLTGQLMVGGGTAVAVLGFIRALK